LNPFPQLVSFLEKKAVSSSLLVNLYARFYHQVVQNEISLAEITEADRVVNLGCGGIPYTSLLVARFTGAQVWAVDRDKEAVQAARRCIASLNLESRVTAINADGASELPVFEVALVALQAEPKKDILENLLQQGRPGARLVFRRPRSDLLHQYDQLPRCPSPVAHIKQKQVTFDCSVLYRANGVSGIQNGVAPGTMQKIPG